MCVIYVLCYVYYMLYYTLYFSMAHKCYSAYHKFSVQNLSIKDALIVVLKLPCNYKVTISNSK